MSMSALTRRSVLAGAAATLLATGAIAADAYPTRTIQMVVPYSAGGGTDVVARFIADALGNTLPQKVVVLNKAGAAGMLGAQAVKAAPADGYTLLFTSQSIVTHEQESQGKISHKDFIFLGMLNQDAIGLAVDQKAKWRTMREFLDDARKAPGTLSVSTTGPGSVTHMQIPLIEKAAGVKLNPIPFPGSAGTQMAVLSNTVNAVSVIMGDGASLLKDGKLRLLGVMSANRVEAHPDVPTYKELGMPLDWIFWRGLFVHKDTPAPVVATLRQAVAKVARSQAFQSRMVQSNYIPAAIVDEPELAAFLRKEEGIVDEVMKSLGK
jgi:tripartite-type tricarboxylate transporter receptor subunit TctC